MEPRWTLLLLIVKLCGPDFYTLGQHQRSRVSLLPVRQFLTALLLHPSAFCFLLHHLAHRRPEHDLSWAAKPVEAGGGATALSLTAETKPATCCRWGVEQRVGPGTSWPGLHCLHVGGCLGFPRVTVIMQRETSPGCQTSGHLAKASVRRKG